MHRRDLLRWLGGGALGMICGPLAARPACAAHDMYVDGGLVAIGGGLTETIFALGAGDQVLGADTTSTYPEPANALPRVGYQHTLTPESILSLRPDVLIHDGSAGPSTTLERVAGAGVKLLTVSGEPSLNGFKIRVVTLGCWLRAEARAMEIIRSVEADLDEARKIQTDLGRPPRLVLLMAHGQGNAVAAGRDTKADALARLCGGENVFQDYSGYRPVSREGVMARRPDALIISGEAAADFGGSLSRVPQYVGDTLFLLGFGPRLGEAVLDVSRFLNQGLAGHPVGIGHS
ncbi:heme/hemin ABC transporter substrate-binding protein [Ectothiorhodospira variabilis]|uniref:heme/hemin ABC transporter substrate-binding protein n=1 Tax=Ectothiorhodospira variabilis TaxID=505694 RepID=UPI001EFAA593|nr:ABC transporter substrate-binding protein [Ectothiorhodospira variabilis]MCG5498072.1 ABC transporter substrate-binding protein [Ectothiorhodospira variabilis]